MAEENKVKNLQKAEKALEKAEKIIEKDIAFEEKRPLRWPPKSAQSKDAAEKKKIVIEAQAFVHRQNLLKMSEISLILDTYDDIFSDFDPRPFDQRAVSDDLLLEIKRASKEKKSGVIELKFLIPHYLRKPEQEILVRKRLREHFRKHYESVASEIHIIRRNGALEAGLGFALAMVAAVILPQTANDVASNILLVLIEPASWFTIWSGFDRIFYVWKQQKPDLDFYSKMSKCEVVFNPY